MVNIQSVLFEQPFSRTTWVSWCP